MHPIVVGVDPSPAGTAALEWAMREAVATGTALRAVRAWTLGAYAVEESLWNANEIVPRGEVQARLEAVELMKLASERVAGADTVECTATAVLGTASQVLVDQAAHEAMIVVGSRGHGALSRAVLGSVSSSVLHHATGPVAIVPEAQDDDGAAPRVIVGMDHSPAAAQALATAADQARRRGATLVPVYVHEPMMTTREGTRGPDPSSLEGNERHLLETAAEAAGATDVQADVLVGQPAEQLLALARPQDLLVVGSRGRGGFAGLLLGSVSTQLAQHACCPVLVIRG